MSSFNTGQRTRNTYETITDLREKLANRDAQQKQLEDEVKQLRIELQRQRNQTLQYEQATTKAFDQILKNTRKETTLAEEKLEAALKDKKKKSTKYLETLKTLRQKNR